jgi:hypothetical protein
MVTDAERQTNILLLNLIADEQSLPDHVMDTEGNETDDLEIVSDHIAIAQGSGDGEYVMTVTASRPGWVYGVAHDPTNCTMQLARVVRMSDGKELPTNVWQTDRTVTANYSSLVDNRLHMADNIGATETYTLYYKPKPAAAPTVSSIALVVPEGTAEGEATQAVVTFAEAVDAATVDSDDFAMTVDGETYGVTVSMTSTTTALIDWKDNRQQSGNAVLTAFTHGIANAEGTTGTTSKSLTWQATVAYTPGDVNDDGIIDVVDIMALALHVRGYTPAVFNLAAADVNGDSSIDVTDIMAIANIIRNN